MNNFNIIPLIILIVLQVMDGYSTYRIISEGKGHEANPMVAFMIDKLGLASGLNITKAAVIGLLVYCSLSSVSIVLTTALFVLVVLYSIIVAHNFSILRDE